MPVRNYEERINKVRDGEGVHDEIASAHHDLLRSWDDQLKLNGKSPATRTDYLEKTSNFLRHEAVDGKDMEEIGKQEVNRFLASKGSEQTVYSYKAPLRQFFLWYYTDHRGVSEDDMPRFVDKQLKASPPSKSKVKAEDVPEKDEVLALMDAARNNRDRALIALLADKGMRISEALSLDRKDVHFDRAGIYIMVPEAKKDYESYRKNRLTFSRPALKDWLDVHPRDEEEAPLFTKMQGERTRLQYDAARAMMNALKDRADVRDHITLHKFRHYSATNDLKDKHMKERYIVKEHGWDDPSMLDRYGHLTDDEVDRARIKQMVEAGQLPADALENGDDDEDAVTVELIRCPNCDHDNAPEADMCDRCHQPFTEEAAEEQERYQQLVEEVLEEKGIKEEIMSRMRG